MFLFLAVLTTISAFTILFAGILTLAQSISRSENRWFFGLTLTLAAWIPVNFFGSNIIQHDLTELLVKIDYSIALVIGWLLLQFAAALMTSDFYKSAQQKPYTAQHALFRLFSGILTGLMMAAIFADLVFTVSIGTDKLMTAIEVLFYPYALVLCSYFVYALVILRRGYMRLRGNAQRGLDLIVTGFIIAFITNIFTNLIAPNLITDRALVKELNILGYVGVVILIGCIYISITKRKLFDIRFFAVRAAAYAVTLAIVTTIYIAPILYIVDKLVPGPEMSMPVFLLVLILMSVAGALYGNVRTKFNKTTNKLFFRDAYDPELFISELNQVTVSTLDINRLLSDATAVIAKNLKAEYCDIGLNGTPHKVQRVIGTHRKVFPPKDLAAIEKMTLHTGFRVVTADLLDQNSSEFQKLLRKNNISVVARLKRETDKGDIGLGYIYLGPKKNGAAYNTQDVRILGTVINGLIVAIQNSLSFEEIQNFNITLQQRIEDATRKLRRTNQKLEALDESKDDFISMASHQLRTPLTAVKGYLSMVLEGDAGDVTPMQKKMLNQAFMSSQRMVFLIADLLNVSRLKTGKFVIESAPLNLANLIHEEIGQLRETASVRGVELSFDKPKDFPDLMLDETKMRQVVMNFMDNAIHYTQAGGHITVELSDKSQSVELRVRDNGIGVPRAEQHHLFTKFYRAGNARRERPDGTGLGLFMAKKVIVAQGGAVVFESKEHKGSTFGFTLPKDKLRVKATQPVSVD